MTFICFSANASFSVSAVLLTVGAITLHRARNRSEMPFAAIPLIFGCQQLVEGLLWLALAAQAPQTHALTVSYLLFSNVLWPIYVPVAIWMIEPLAAPRRKIALPMAAGVATSVFFLAALVSQPASAAIMGMHIKYVLPHPHHTLAFAFYAAATCIAPLLSSLGTVRLFGIVLIGSMIASYLVYATWFASVWCFFAALVSGIVLLHFRGRRRALAAQP